MESLIFKILATLGASGIVGGFLHVVWTKTEIALLKQEVRNQQADKLELKSELKGIRQDLHRILVHNGIETTST